MAERQVRRPDRSDFLDELSRHLQGPDTTAQDLRAQQLQRLSGQMQGMQSQAFRALEQGNIVINGVVMGWLNEAYLGPGVHDLFLRNPPRVVTRPPDFFERFRDALGFRPTGFSPIGSDEIFLSSELIHEADRYNLMAHEQLHQASELGGGLYSIRWRQGSGTIELRGEAYSSWLHEGMTELHSQQLVRQHGFEPTFVGYPHQTMTCFFIEGIVVMQVGEEEGQRIVRDAYLSGDFTQVAQLFDQYLGPGSFERLMRMPDSLTAASWLFDSVRDKMGDRLLSFDGSAAFLRWFDDPIMVRAMGQVGMNDPSQGFRQAIDRLSRQRGD